MTLLHSSLERPICRSGALKPLYRRCASAVQMPSSGHWPGGGTVCPSLAAKECRAVSVDGFKLPAQSGVTVMRVLFLAVGLCLYAGGAIAAPFCAVFSYGTQCYYFDMPSCQRAAGTAGACIVNQQEVQQSLGQEQPIRPLGSGPRFCVVQSFGTQCFYYDAQSCRDAAARSGGACVVRQ